MRRTALLAWLMIAGCGDGDPERRIDGVTPEEAAQLDNAAEMLDEPLLPVNDVAGSEESGAAADR